ncbi:MAG: CPBP family intramembrane glutamic endopeptidase [Cyclobacteriaceae bacterium]
MKLIQKVKYYFLPGLVPTALLVLFHTIFGERWPSITILIIIDMLVTIPLMLRLLSKGTGTAFGFRSVRLIFQSQNCVFFRTSLITIIFSLFWAIGAFIILRPIGEFIHEAVFSWIPPWFTPMLDPQLPNKWMLKFTWFLLITFSIVMPLSEEIYFRGFLLPREKYKDWRAPLVNTVLFCAYHIWSPWLILTRVIATFPMYYFVWKYRNISLSIIPHILLNLVGDVILMYPLIFNQ